ncbi:MAG: tol-pal system protein YbgF [Pseudomonadota bacterium]
MKSLRILLLAAAALSAAACTPLNRSGEQPLSPEEIRMRAVEAKLTEVGRRVNAVENKDDTKLQDDLRSLRGEIERMRFDLETQSRRSKDVGADVERRLQKLEAQPAAALPPQAGLGMDGSEPAPTVPPVIFAPPVSAAASADAGSTAAEEQTAYLKAFDSLKAGKYDAAITNFKGMLEKWPQGNFADNAWYWLGESQYVKRQYKPALDSYTALVTRFPASPKVPDALFKSGLTQVELQQTDQAKASWRRVMKDYPNSNAAGLARQRLTQTP